MYENLVVVLAVPDTDVGAPAVDPEVGGCYERAQTELEGEADDCRTEIIVEIM